MADKPPISLTQCTTPQETTDKRSLEITENTWLNMASAASGLYIHIPFCFHKCHYCDFFSIANADDEHIPFTDALVSELQTVAPHLGEIKTIFIGGGTPTLLEDSLGLPYPSPGMLPLPGSLLQAKQPLQIWPLQRSMHLVAPPLQTRH